MMTTALDIAILAVVTLPLLPATLFLAQVLAALVPARQPEYLGGARPRVAVLIPAHDESQGIVPVIQSVREGLSLQDRVLVVADNCSDNTAALATATGAEVVERHDVSRLGKGYALARGIEHLQRNPPDVVIVIDADCHVAPGALDLLVRQCHGLARPVQALYLMHALNPGSPGVAFAAFAWLVKNRVRPLGYRRLGQPCQLMGSGMAFPWSVLQAAPLAQGHLVEDLKLGLDLARVGHAPAFCPEALVTSTFPAVTAGVKSQRTRWEHGHLGMIGHDAPRYLLDALRTANPALLALVLDLCIPPLALLAMLSTAAWALALAHGLLSGFEPALWIASTTLAMLASAVMVSWLAFGRQTISLAQLAHAPAYALAKIPLYLRFLTRRQAVWVRSSRDKS